MPIETSIQPLKLGADNNSTCQFKNYWESAISKDIIWHREYDSTFIWERMNKWDIYNTIDEALASHTSKSSHVDQKASVNVETSLT